mmetsp:Transcript_14565/g.45763  ORF Transcript_14565/g.45763 Transcript_14565/m.45763 type:complete len:209 (+) Transcript_14565:476-1102(+)
MVTIVILLKVQHGQRLAGRTVVGAQRRSNRLAPPGKLLVKARPFLASVPVFSLGHLFLRRSLVRHNCLLLRHKLWHRRRRHDRLGERFGALRHRNAKHLGTQHGQRHDKRSMHWVRPVKGYRGGRSLGRRPEASASGLVHHMVQRKVVQQLQGSLAVVRLELLPRKDEAVVKRPRAAGQQPTGDTNQLGVQATAVGGRQLGVQLWLEQ